MGKTTFYRVWDLYTRKSFFKEIGNHECKIRYKMIPYSEWGKTAQLLNVFKVWQINVTKSRKIIIFLLIDWHNSMYLYFTAHFWLILLTDHFKSFIVQLLLKEQTSNSVFSLEVIDRNSFQCSKLLMSSSVY